MFIKIYFLFQFYMLFYIHSTEYFSSPCCVFLSTRFDIAHKKLLGRSLEHYIAGSKTRLILTGCLPRQDRQIHLLWHFKSREHLTFYLTNISYEGVARGGPEGGHILTYYDTWQCPWSKPCKPRLTGLMELIEGDTFWPLPSINQLLAPSLPDI